jgi:hypothetical protein
VKTCTHMKIGERREVVDREVHVLMHANAIFFVIFMHIW